MILTCPACATRYRVEAQELEVPEGRMVRCANCGHAWRETTPTAETRRDEGAAFGEAGGAEPMRAAEAAPLSASRLDLPAHLPPGPPPLADYSQARSATQGRAVVIAFVVMVLAILAGVFALHHLIAISRPAERIADPTGLPVKAPGFGLTIGKIAPARTPDGLMIDGEIANVGSVAANVPRLLVVLQNAAKQEVQQEIVDPPKARLQPGETVHFATPFAHPQDAASSVVVSFASH
jgi:predicted Zn finger-like uncharacterized protein